jgi:cellobiose-specific phosphotransferase system component IIB
MAQANIDILAPKKSIIDLTDSHNNNLDGLIDQNYELGFLFDDIILVEYIDEVSDGQGDAVLRGGVYIPTNAVQRAWRKGRVILAGPECKYTKKEDIVIFPNNLGVGISNADIANYGVLKKGIFLNESRLFGIAKEKNESKSTNSKK